MSFMAHIEAHMDIAARRSVRAVVGRRFRAFVRDPIQIDAIEPGLSRLEGAAMLARIEELLTAEREAQRRWRGFGGEIPLLNLMAARAAGRYFRRADGPRDTWQGLGEIVDSVVRRAKEGKQ